MNAVVVVVFLILVVAVVGLVIVVLRNPVTGAAERDEAAAEPVRSVPALLEFHVRGDEVQVFFAVPLPEGGAGPVLEDLLAHEGIEVLREKRAHGLPLGDLRRVRVFGRRGEDPVEACVVELPGDEQLPEVRAPELVPHAVLAGYDPLAHLGEMEAEAAPPQLEERPAGETLRPFVAEVRLAAPVEAALRAQGIDPAGMRLDDLVLGLFRAAGYGMIVDAHGLRIGEGDRADVYRVTKAGAETILAIVPHEPGTYPELAESVVNGFLVLFGRLGPDRALLVSDKYGPYLIYEKERREPRCRFVTRERLQAFVDAFAIR